MSIKEQIKEFILAKVKKETSKDRPYYFIRGTGLSELCEKYGLNVLEIIDELYKEGKVKKALIHGKLAIFIHKPIDKKKLANIEKEFQEFISK